MQTPSMVDYIGKRGMFTMLSPILVTSYIQGAHDKLFGDICQQVAAFLSPSYTLKHIESIHRCIRDFNTRFIPNT